MNLKARKIQHRKKSTKKMAPKLHREIVRVVKQVEKKEQELKQFATSQAFTAVAGTAASMILLALTAMAQGTTDITRIGDQVDLHSIYIRGNILNGDGATSNRYNDIRIIVFQYNNTDATPSASEIFLTNSVSGDRSAYSSRDIDYLSKYHFLFDRTYHVEGGNPNAANYSPTGNLSKHFEINVPMKHCKKKIQYIAGGTNANNNVFIGIIGFSPSVATNPSVGFACAVKYYDA